jgi:hypothetical protein
MKLNILAIVIILMMISNAFIASANVKNDDNIEPISTSDVNLVEIRVAMYSQFPSTYDIIYNMILDGYKWIVGNKSYIFTIDKIKDKDIIRGKLTISNYDSFIIPWDQAEQMYIRYSLHSIRNKIWKENIANFIKDGGGYFSYCSGTAFVCGMAEKPETLGDILLERTNLGISHVKIFRERSLPFLWGYPFLFKLSTNPEVIGWKAYEFYSGKQTTSQSAIYQFSAPGIPVDFKINRNNPIFDDLHEDTRRIYCSPGGTYVIPDEYKDDVTVLALFPDLEISDNKSTQIHYWKYTGGFKGVIKSFTEARKNKGVFTWTIFPYQSFAGDWEMTNEIVQTNHSNKSFMTMESYPNENKGRIVLTYGHPELLVWWGGHMVDVNDKDNNFLKDGLYKWVDVTPFNETVEDEITYNWWIVRRQAAWASKVPDNDLPPVYGPSQVSDIYPYEQQSTFTIIGNAETTIIESEWVYQKESLELYYRYSADNGTTESWSDWILYGTDYDISDGWSWEFNASHANGSGYYQFYSIRNVQYENEWLNESAPPGPDTIAKVVQ